MSTLYDADLLLDDEQAGIEGSSKPVVSVDKKEEAKIEKFERCSFCNSKLLFTHELNLSYFQVIEAARCPGCGVTPKSKIFTLH